MATNKNDIELVKLTNTRQINLAVIGLIATFFRVGGFVLAAKFVMDGLEQIVLSKPDSINALAKLTDAMHLGTVAGLVLLGGAGVAWKRERIGKKRAIQRYAALKHKYEPDESSSGLTDTGDTPEEN